MSKIKCVMVEAGHGLSQWWPAWARIKDSGAVFGEITEYDINCAVASRVVTILRSKPELAEAVVQGIGYDQRARIQEKLVFANGVVSQNQFSKEECLYACLHCNSNTGVAGTGIETYQGTGNSANLKFAAHLRQSLIEYFGFKDRGNKVNTSLYHRSVNANSVLLEMGFINSTYDLTCLTAYDRMALAVAHGILEHVREVASIS